jgi:hypothetical protein
MALLFILPWVVYLNISNAGATPELLSRLLLPLPIFLVVGLYWIRWWALKPQRLYAQMLRDHEAF